MTKPDHLENLATISQTQHDALDSAMQADPAMKGVVKVTTADMVSFPNAIGYTGALTSNSSTVVVSTIAYLEVGMAISGSNIPPNTTIAEVHPAASTIVLSNSAMATVANVALTISNAIGSSAASQTFNDLVQGTKTGHTWDKTNTLASTSFSDIPNVGGGANPPANQTGHSTSSSKSDPVVQHTENKGYTFRHPTSENNAENERTQTSLLDERFKQFMYSQQLPFLKWMFPNELTSIDLEVKRLQVSFINTMLVCPIKGIITGLFKHAGDCVQAGQPILRVEQDDVILIVGTLTYRNVLQVGAKVDISTILYDAAAAGGGSAAKTPLPQGHVIAIRGHKYEDDQWDVIIQCDNLFDAQGNPLIPLNYNFDFDDTDVTITP